MRWTPVIVLMSDDLIAALEDDVHDCETRLNADDELSELWTRNGWDPRMMAYGLIYQQYAASDGVAAGPQATPDQAYEGTLGVYEPDEYPPYAVLHLDDDQGSVVFKPGTRLSVRVVAAPTGDQEGDGG